MRSRAAATASPATAPPPRPISGARNSRSASASRRRAAAGTFRHATSNRRPSGKAGSRRSPGAGVRKYFAASAWVVGGASDGYNAKLYVASGYRSADDATAAAIKACSDATSRPCESNALTGNGFIQAYRMNDSDDSATAETSAKRAQEAARVNCKKLKSATCELQAVFDSRKPGLFVHDFAGAKAR